jgi:hypothetical protein
MHTHTLRRHLAILALAFTLLAGTPTVHGSPVAVEGYVVDQAGAPLGGARVILYGSSLVAEATTSPDGHYRLEANPSTARLTLYATYDDPDTGNYDCLPQARLLAGADSYAADFTLPPAATIQMTGQIKPVETTSTIRFYTVSALDPSTGDRLKSGDLILEYGSGTRTINSVLGLDPDTLILPVETPLVLQFRSQTEVASRSTRVLGWGTSYAQAADKPVSFTISEGEPFVFIPGQRVELDYRRYSLAQDVDTVSTGLSQAEARLTELEAGGFYVTAERFDLKEAAEQLGRAEARHAVSDYEACYVELSSAYLKWTVLSGRLGSMVAEAAVSVKTLIVFVALTATVIGGFLAERRGLMMVTAGISFAIMITYLYKVYPGSALIPAGEFAAVSAVSLSLFALPLILSGLVGRGSSWATLKAGEWVSMFSFGKRNLRRRRLRFALTFVPIMLLTMSFVALTSMSTGYGLVSQWVPYAEPDAAGILVRMSEYEPKTEFEKGIFYTVIQPAVEWVAGYEGVASVALKAESTPQVRPIATVDGYDFRGVIGLDVEGEPLMPGVDACVVEGEPLREEDTCLVHVNVFQYTGLGLGDTLTIRGVPMTIVGAFDSGIVDVMDADGGSFLPGYQVIVNPGDDQPRVEVRTVEPYYAVVTTLMTAQRMSGVRASRVTATLEPGADGVTLGKSMALSREYRVWVSTGAEVLRASMTDTIAGKGFGVTIPWLIVVLNVLATMMGSMYERRAEINILSSVGLNPTHISGVFLAEALITGVTAGGLGYLIGLGWYPAMRALADAPVVNQKVSAFWVVGSLAIAVTAVAAGSVLALRGSTVITPSFIRNWRLEGSSSPDDTWSVALPNKVKPEEVDALLAYICDALRAYDDRESAPHIYGVKQASDGEGRRFISFTYREVPTNIGAKTSYNRLVVEPGEEADVYGATLVSKGTREAVESTVVFMRKLMIQWTVFSRSRGRT